VLYCRAGRVLLIKRTGVPVAPALHLLHPRLVPLVESRQLAAPAARFRVPGVSLAILCKNAPEPVELTMFPQQMLAAEERRRQVPDPHEKPF
jgi:hypothetical protein